MTWTPYYKPKFYRHLNHLVINGFYARTLDADDHAFIESVKTKGIANGSLPSTNAVLVEELGFWEFPYTIQPGIERKVGSDSIRRPRVEETPEQREQRRIRTSAWHARREIRKQEREIAAAEMAREERRQAAARQKRAVREIISDAEWDAAAPREAPFGSIINGKYVPEWKLEEMGIAPPPRPKPIFRRMSAAARRELADRQIEQRREEIAVAKKKAERIAARRALIAEQDLQQEMARQAAERRRKRRKPTTKTTRAERRAALKCDAEIAKELGLTAGAQRKKKQAVWLTEQEIARREQILAEARETVANVARMESEWQANYTPKVLKEAILSLLNSTPGQNWTADEMMRAVGGCTREFLEQCINELVRDGKLRRMETP